MRVTLWGTRGSLASPGSETERFGGNTACVEVRDHGDSVLVLDAGTGIRRLGASIDPSIRRVDILLSHLHMDHIQGLGFFAPLYLPDVEVHIWGPASTTHGLQTRLSRYLSPPFFPVHLRDLKCRLQLHEVPCGTFEIGPFQVFAALVCHPGPTVGYRISSGAGTLAYLSDHEPALGVPEFPLEPEWTSGFPVAVDADLLIHDAQYRADEYPDHVGWGHSAFDDVLRFAALARVRHLVTFHHDPSHSDSDIEAMLAAAPANLPFQLSAGAEGATFELPARESRPHEQTTARN
jgi:phosphoribosyl 1,2-cyclic phosphodiesterase